MTKYINAHKTVIICDVPEGLEKLLDKIDFLAINTTEDPALIRELYLEKTLQELTCLNKIIELIESGFTIHINKQD